MVISFAVGMVFGAVVAVFALALCNIAGRDKREDE